jgi:hypothetical protein
MKYLLSIFSLACFFSSTIASASDAECKGCSYSAMMNKASSLGKGDHRIYDLNVGVIYGFNVRCANEVIQRGGPTSDSNIEQTRKLTNGEVSAVGGCPFNASRIVEERMLSNQELQSFSAVYDYFVSRGKSFEGDVVVDLRNHNDTGPFADSVIPAILDNVRRTQMFDYVARNRLNGFNAVYSFIQVLERAALAHLQILPNQLIVTVIFKNGSKVNIKYTAADNKFEIIKTTARDEANNPVIESNAEGFAGNYPIVGNNLSDYLNYLSLIGVPISNGQGTTLTCTWNGVKLSCTVRNMNN